MTNPTPLPEAPSVYAGWFEKESAANTSTPPQYRYNHTLETPRGHLIELDDTPGRERIRISHRANSFVELAPDGNGTFKMFGSGAWVSIKDTEISVGVDDGQLASRLNINVYGDCNMHVAGDMIQTIDGNFEQYVGGSYTQTVIGSSAIHSNEDMTIGGGYGPGTGSVTIEAGDHFFIDADLAVNGEMTATKITSMTRVEGITGVSAGPLGFVSETGGLALGVPVAVPGSVIAMGFGSFTDYLVSGVSVASPTATFGTMTSVLMEDHVNTLVFNTHIHPVAYGPTGTPVTNMISV